MPKVSIIIPTYNRLKYLKRSIPSVLNQNFKDWDLWVIDDGSTDKTEDFIAEIQSDHKNQPIYYLKTPNKGVSHARNLGIKNSKGEWIAFLDSDDEWKPEKLEQQINHSKTTTSQLIHTDETWIRNGMRVNPHNKHKKFGGRIFSKSLPLCCISPSTAMIHRNIFNDVGLFREDFPVCEDYDLWLRITAKHDVYFIEEPLIIKYGGHEDQLSKKFFAMDYWRIKSLKELHNSPLISEEENNLLQEVLLKKSKILLKGYVKHNNLDNYSEIQNIMNTILRLTDKKTNL